MRTLQIVVAVVVAAILGTVCGWLGIAPIYVATFEEYIGSLRSPYSAAVLGLIYYGIAFVLASTLTALIAKAVVPRSRILAVVVVGFVGPVSYVLFQGAAMLAFHVALGFSTHTPVADIFLSGVAGVLFALVFAVFLAVTSNSPGAPPNATQQLSRPGAGPAAELP